MYQLPNAGFLRITQILQLIPISKSTWWAGVKEGYFPKPIKLSPRVTAWRVEDIKQLIEQEFQEYKPRRGKLCKK
ncbi:helix-turn-helix transcriptional regulator [Legionella shakespearei]|uniref:Prophage CP4-57 regulatory protein (AlpA) n=1 Tax=Legionella shakespearei DSM 23087 TaxID=1122169 RepID=A0A0W0YRG7_9GAMM|nr:AlpA family phage regulatory protein [Legionella shakespearei]KTD59295.1 Prophage CP4-57 regulatory protein (AlpA) [Legionella shakespearei DSM 23087]